MPVWLQIISLVVGLIGTVFGIFGVSSFIGEKAKHRAQKQIIKEEKEVTDLEAWRHQAFINEIKEVVGEVIAPLAKDVAEIKISGARNEKATIAGLRATMKELRDRYIAQGYADIGDKATWNELYDDYKDMGGNHFKEWVNQWKEDVNNLPLKKCSKRAGKTVLNENKK